MNALHGCRTYIQAHGRLTQKERKQALPVVTISREAGAGAFTVAEMAAKLLNEMETDEKAPPWTVFDRNLVEKALEDHELPRALKRFMPEDVAPFMTDAVEELLGLHPSAWTLVQHTTETILRLARLGNVILIGRGASFITSRMEHAVHIRFVAPLEVRVRHLMDITGMKREQALEYAHISDRARKRYVQRYFDAAIDDPLNYDLVLNTGRVSFQTAACLIVKTVAGLVHHGMEHCPDQSLQNET